MKARRIFIMSIVLVSCNFNKDTSRKSGEPIHHYYFYFNSTSAKISLVDFKKIDMTENIVQFYNEVLLKLTKKQSPEMMDFLKISADCVEPIKIKGENLYYSRVIGHKEIFYFHSHPECGLLYVINVHSGLQDKKEFKLLYNSKLPVSKAELTDRIAFCQEMHQSYLDRFAGRSVPPNKK